MSSQPSAPSAPPPDGEAKGTRLHIRGIREMPAGHDEQLAVIFKEMRRAAGVSQEEIAGQLATSVETIAELESGAVLALPEWSELERIVSAYTARLGLDARPVLRRLQAQLVVEEPLVAPPAGGPPMPSAPPAPPAPANAPQPGALPMPPSAAVPEPPRPAPPQPPPQSPFPRMQGRPAPPQPPPAVSAQPAPQAPQIQPQTGEPARDAQNSKPRTGRLARMVRPLVNWAILLGFVAALGAGVWYAAKRPRAVWSTLDSLPAPIPRLVRTAWELVRPIENTRPGPPVSDPDGRKSDKLR